jgi:hypothetical protein
MGVPVFVSVGLLVLVHERGPIWRRLASHAGFTATAAYFVMDVAAIWIDIVGGQRARLYPRRGSCSPRYGRG